MAEKNDDNLMGALAYILGWLSGLIVFLVKKDSKFAKFHAMQSILLNVVAIVITIIYGIGLTIVGMVIGFVTSGCGTILIPIGMLVYMVICLAVVVFLMYKAYTGVKYKLPVIGNLAEKYSG